MPPDAAGRELMLAAALGLDVACRVALAARWDCGQHRNSAVGVSGATAVAAWLLRLLQKQVLYATVIA